MLLEDYSSEPGDVVMWKDNLNQKRNAPHNIQTRNACSDAK
jgi:hypothetical protein